MELLGASLNMLYNPFAPSGWWANSRVAIKYVTKKNMPVEARAEVLN
jgi:hypothetical protein